MSRPFRFSLQKVLEYRVQLEDQAKLAFARAQAALDEQRLVVAAIEEALSRHARESAQKPQNTAADMWLNRNYAKRLAEDLLQAQTVQTQLEQVAEMRRLELVERAKELKLLEKLKEKQAQRHARDEEHKEQSQFDEMATLRYQAPAL